MKQTLALALAFFAAFFATAFTQEPEQWSRFRGPNGQGISTATGLPTHWSADENIAWKIPIPGEGWSSPVIWNDHIFLTTADNGGTECRIIAINRKNGEILWNKLVFTQEIRHRHPRNSEATPTPVTDGQRVYTVFASGHFAAVDFKGEIVWTNTDIDFYSHHGFGASPIIYDDLLITAVNPSNKEEPKGLGWNMPWDKSYLLALDKNTGKERWHTLRGMSRISHSTPVVIDVNGKTQIVSMAGDVVQGFDPANGELIWTVRSEGEPAVTTPAIGEGMVFATTTNVSPITGIKTDGKGDCTDTHVLWRQSRNVPMTASLLYVKPCVYAAPESGTFSAFDAATGEFLWQDRIEGRLDSSPIYADGKIYVTSHVGITKVYKPNDDPKKRAEIVAVNDIGETTVQATLAVAGKQLFLRTEKELWCIGK
ncbi:MAG: PQQ-binding-like beta-propeller repeat protein [Planctomycetaceae bacterium]|jgi:outer membrane protein assembly factor BamB|nr:PQQ-binding-like beta-propeller repeat protein [Planctomycetaceae bacterium]